MKRLAVLLVLLALALPASAAQLPILASQDLWPVFSPDGKHVAFTLLVNGQGRTFALDVVDTRTKRVVQVAEGSTAPSPTWAADGRIAYAANGVLHKANAAGTGKYRYPSASSALAPAWRPRSEQLAYLTSQGAVNLDLWVGSDALGERSDRPAGLVARRLTARLPARRLDLGRLTATRRDPARRHGRRAGCPRLVARRDARGLRSRRARLHRAGGRVDPACTGCRPVPGRRAARLVAGRGQPRRTPSSAGWS